MAGHLVHDREHPGVDVVAPERIGRALRMRLDRLDHGGARLGMLVDLGGRGDRDERSERRREQRRAPESGVHANARSPIRQAWPVALGVARHIDERAGVCRVQAMDWRRYGPEEIEAQFNPRRSVPDFEDHQARHAAWSAAARTQLDGHLDVPYGAGPLHKIDMFPAPGARRRAAARVLPRRLLARAGQGEFRAHRQAARGRGHLRRDRQLRPVPGGDPGRHGRVSPARDRLDLAPCARVRRRSRPADLVRPFRRRAPVRHGARPRLDGRGPCRPT